jgi:acyl-CoA synthetase (AMP-forming)/AMP-acid ligase II
MTNSGNAETRFRPPAKILGSGGSRSVMPSRLRPMPAEHSADLRRSTPFSSLPELLEHQAGRIPDAPAILAPGRAPLSYSRLYQHIEQTGRVLRAMGLGRHDRVAVVLPSGPEMAVALLAVAAGAVCAPLNPAYGTEELERYFADLRARALITTARLGSPVRRAGLSRGIRVVELSTADDAEAGLFTLTGEQRGAPSDDSVSPRDVALLQLTSGTTSRPKIVPLTHANICTSANTWGAALALTETDRCLNVMPLFHGHGLIATVLASLAAGSSVVCTAGYEANSFFGWLTTFRPTWYSAVPTLHRAILAQARHHREPAADHRLRFVRSGAAPLPPTVFAELERTFQTPVIEFCGMTETAASPIACNPLPPRQRKAGSIGLPVDLEIAIMDEGGAFLPHGRTGQIVVRGASVMPGYDGDPMATRAAFAGDWFKTGDLGFFDDDGYLFLVGRSREIINRGGEKIGPWEVDEVLLEHPAVAEAVTFAVPHPTLGEDVAAAVVMRPHARATTKAIRRFLIGRVADFKVPRQVLIVSELPKSPTGKVQRVGLAAKLGLASRGAVSPTFAAPRTPLEKMLAGLWEEVLQVERVSIHDNFFALGGDSLLVTHVLSHVYEIMHLEIEVSRFFEAPTIAEMAHHLETSIQTGQVGRPSSAIVRVRREDGVPASIAQERLWKLQRVLRGAPFFNILYALRLTPPVDAAVLERSVNEIVRRHEILRTTFAVVDGRHVQVIAPELTVRLRFDDLHALPASKKETVGHQLMQEEALHSFDLAQGPLFRARLARVAEREHLLLITMHRIIVDEWSLGVLVDELFTLYEAFSARAASPLPPLSIQYPDFAYWQRHWRSHPDIVSQLTYWREQLCVPLPEIELAKARPRHTIDGLRTARRGLALPARLSEAATRFSHREGGTLFMALVAALKTLLHRYVRQDDLRVATLVANRNRPRTEGLIGPLANTVILRTNLGGDPSLREVMRRVRATTLAAFANQDLPFEELVDTLEQERALRRATLAQVMVTLQSGTRGPVAGSGHTLTLQETGLGMPVPLLRATTCEISLMFREGTHGLTGSCIYKPHLFDAITIDRLLRDFQVVLERMVAEPERPISTICVSLNEKPSSRA